MPESRGGSVSETLVCESARVLAISIAVGSLLLPGCSGAGDDAPGEPGRGGSNASGGTSSGATSGLGGASGSGGAGTGGAGAGGSAGAGTGGTSGSATGGAASGGAATGGVGGSATGGVGGVGGVAGSGGVDPNAITLGAIPANGTVGLEWPRVAGATGYRLYWANTAGVTPGTGQAFDVTDATYVHRALTNGTPYYYVVTALTAAGEGPASNEVTATPGGEWVLEELGAGDFDDIVTGARVPRIPVAKRIHVLLLPEGYLSTELSIFHDHAEHAGQRRNDVDRWVDEVFGKDPYSHFRSAFVIWYLRRASTTHVGGGNSAFGILMSGGSVGDTNAAAAPLWAALDDQGSDAFPFPPTAFYAGGGRRAKNLVASFMILDPDNMRAGFSGRATTLQSPGGQRLNAGFARGHAHEFTHAFANVRDEYMEDNNSATGNTSEMSNVSGTNRCDDLPWSHLLAGRGIHATQGLVGAFGRTERGFHSELGCHMNGTHDNGAYWCSAGDERYPDGLTLRPNHFCNWCREIISFRVFERSQVLAELSDSFPSWSRMHRPRFFERFGFQVPEGPIPQTLSCNRDRPGKAVFEDCVP